MLVVQALPGTAPSRPQLLALAVGLGTVLTLVAWAWAEYRAASAALAPAAPGLSVAPGDPAVPGLSVAPGDPAAPGLSVAPVREPGHLPGSADTPPSAPWHRSSTPWPKRDEDDPEGTVIRPPRHI